MPTTGSEVGEIFRRYSSAFLDARGDSISHEQRRVLASVADCRTAALGGHVKECDQCGHLEVFYNSCRHRACPKCLGAASARWLDARRAELLPVPYFHVVFSIPEKLQQLALQNKKVVYDILFRSVSETLHQIAGDPQHLGAQITFLAILHTWGQSLLHHPHIHCVIPGGGLSPDKSRWIPCRDEFFLPVRVLSRLFRGKFLALVQAAFDKGKLSCHGRLAHLVDPPAFKNLLQSTRSTEWVVYCKPPFGSPDQVLKYLARYTHKVAIANSRLVSIDEGVVTFRYKDYKRNNASRVMKLEATEFIRRFLLHVLPKSFVRIRHYGFLANRVRKGNIALCHDLLGVPDLNLAPERSTTEQSEGITTSVDAHGTNCPVCGKGRLVEVRELQPGEAGPPCHRLAWDTS